MKPTLLLRHSCKHILESWVREFVDDYEIVGATCSMSEAQRFAQVLKPELILLNDVAVEVELRPWMRQVLAETNHAEIILVSHLNDSAVTLGWMLDGVFIIWNDRMPIKLSEAVRMACSRFYRRKEPLSESA